MGDARDRASSTSCRIVSPYSAMTPSKSGWRLAANPETPSASPAAAPTAEEMKFNGQALQKTGCKRHFINPPPVLPCMASEAQ